jgi:hypothetical protein
MRESRIINFEESEGPNTKGSKNEIQLALVSLNSKSAVPVAVMVILVL